MISVSERLSAFLNQERKHKLAQRGTLISAFFVVALLCPKLTPEMRVASVAYTFLVAGFLFRKERNWHGRFMGVAMTMDISLVLYLEYKRAAIEKVAALSISKLQALHVGFSTGATLLYFPLLVLGLLAFRHRLDLKGRAWHKKIGILTFILRTLGFIFMFSFLK